MKNKKWMIVLGLAFALQLYVPAQMIFERENIAATGRLFKFRTAPVDPSDPFRGKYVLLEFSAASLKVKDANKWAALESCYAILDTNAQGFASIRALSQTRPETTDYVTISPTYAAADDKLGFRYPFNRFYMEESKAPVAERVHRLAMRDTSAVTHANVYVKNGEAVVDDVLIDGKSLRQIVIENQSGGAR